MRIFLKAGVVLASISFYLLLSSCGKDNPVSVTAPGTPTLSLPADGATDQPMTTTLTWSTVSTATTYHIQVSSSSTFSSFIAEDSSLTAATATVHWLVDSTTYYWRARAKNAAGVSNWTDPWHFTVITGASFLEGHWAGIDPIADSWLYYFKGNTVVISKIRSMQDDTVETYRGVFVMDSSVTPHTMDIHLTTPQYNGQTIQTIYDYIGMAGSSFLCDIVKNDPGAARPTDVLNDPNLLLLYYQLW